MRQLPRRPPRNGVVKSHCAQSSRSFLRSPHGGAVARAARSTKCGLSIARARMRCPALFPRRTFATMHGERLSYRSKTHAGGIPMNKRRTIMTIACLTVLAVTASAQDTPTYAERLGWPADARVVIFHCDDAGMSHSSNLG